MSSASRFKMLWTEYEWCAQHHVPSRRLEDRGNCVSSRKWSCGIRDWYPRGPLSKCNGGLGGIQEPWFVMYHLRTLCSRKRRLLNRIPCLFFSDRLRKYVRRFALDVVKITSISVHHCVWPYCAGIVQPESGQLHAHFAKWKGHNIPDNFVPQPDGWVYGLYIIRTHVMRHNVLLVSTDYFHEQNM